MTVVDPTGPVAQRFPLIARPRPPCTALTARITALTALADTAARDGDLTAASRVHNQAALIASDCGQPQLARAWCHRHARAYLTRPAGHATSGRQALEPLVNLARLHIRAGNGDAAVGLLDDLYQAVLTRTDTVIDGIAVPAAALTSTADHHRDLSQWLWSVCIADGTRALTSTGRWDQAETQLRRHHGIGQRMLDGRQVAVIARATRGHPADAQQLIAQTEPGEPWEDAVTACLTALARPAGDPLPDAHLQTMINRYQLLRQDAALVVFRTRLGLSIIDAVDDVAHPAVRSMAQHLVHAVLSAGDGYAARDLLAHPACLDAVDQLPGLNAVLRGSELGQPLPPTAIRLLDIALATSEDVIAQRIPTPATT